MTQYESQERKIRDLRGLWLSAEELAGQVMAERDALLAERDAEREAIVAECLAIQRELSPAGSLLDAKMYLEYGIVSWSF